MRSIAIVLFLVACADGPSFDADDDVDLSARDDCYEAIGEAQDQCGGEFVPLRDPFKNLCEDVATCGEDAEHLIDCLADCYYCWDGWEPVATFQVACLDGCAEVYLGDVHGCWGE